MRYDEKVDTSKSRQAPPRSPRKPVSALTTPAAGSAGDRSPAALTALQRSAGNAAVTQSLAVQRAEEEHRHGDGCGHQSVQRTTAGPETSVQRARYETTKTQRDPDSDNYDSDDDNFDRVIGQLTPPTDYSTVAGLVAQGSESGVYLWRGTSASTANNIVSKGSAGGRTADSNVSAPSREASRSQVGHGGQLPEFTTSTGVAEGFSFRGVLVVVYIAAKYLAKGSSSEEGWIADPRAPLTVVDMVDRTRQQTSNRHGNAS